MKPSPKKAAVDSRAELFNKNGEDQPTISSEKQQNRNDRKRDSNEIKKILKGIRRNDIRSNFITPFIISLIVGFLTSIVTFISITMENATTIETTKYLIAEQKKPNIVYERSIPGTTAVKCFASMLDYYSIPIDRQISISCTYRPYRPNGYELEFRKMLKESTYTEGVYFDAIMVIFCNAGEGPIVKMNALLEPKYRKQNKGYDEVVDEASVYECTSSYISNYIEPVFQKERFAIFITFPKLLPFDYYFFTLTINYQSLYKDEYFQSMEVDYTPSSGISFVCYGESSSQKVTELE